MKWYRLSSVYVTGYTGETPIVTLKENNVELSRESTLTAMTAGSYFHDIEKRRVYIWPIESDNPNSNGKVYVFYVLLGFCDTEASYPIQGEPEIFYMPCINLNSTPPFSRSISELFTGQITSGFGDISLACPEWFYTNKDNYIWKNSEIRALYGEVGGNYGSYIEILYGLIQNITFQSTGANLSIIDIRERLYTFLPPDRFTTAIFPYLDPGLFGETRAVLVGEKWGITPGLINTITNTYEVSQVGFTFKSFAGIEEIAAVYKDGVPLIAGIDYTVDLANGQFTLAASAGESLITCDAKGLKISRDFLTNTWNDTYSKNIADIIYFYLRLQGITDAYIDEAGFETLQGVRAGYECGDWIYQQGQFYEKLRELQTTGQFQLLPTASGKIQIIPYIQTSAPIFVFTNEYYKNFTISKGAEVFNEIIVKFDREPARNKSETTGGDRIESYLYFSRVDPSVSYLYQTTGVKEFKSIVNNANDASAIANDLGTLYNRPVEFISFQTNHELIDLKPLDIIEINYSEIINGVDTPIYDQEPFLVTSVSIAFNGYISIMARKSPSTIQGLYWTDEDSNVITDENGNGITT
jgi:hypothetical protein